MHISLHMHTYVCTFVCMRNTYLHSYMLVSGQVSVPTPTCAVLLFVRHSSRCPWCYKACTEASGLLTVVCVVCLKSFLVTFYLLWSHGAASAAVNVTLSAHLLCIGCRWLT